MDKFDRLGDDGVRQLLTVGRKDESGDFTKGAGLDAASVQTIMSVFEQVADASEKIAQIDLRLKESHVGQQGRAELENIQSLIAASGYADGRVVIDLAVVRGLEYYTGPVFEVELTFPTAGKDGATRLARSAAAGATTDLFRASAASRCLRRDFPSASRGSPLPSPISANSKASPSRPVVVTVFDQDRLADYQQMVASLRGAGIRAELYLGSGKFGAQMKYADKRNAPCTVIQGSDEKAKGEVTIKDLVIGAELSKLEKGRDEYLQ